MRIDGALLMMAVATITELIDKSSMIMEREVNNVEWFNRIRY